MSNEDDCLTQLAELERALKHHPHAEVKNFERLDGRRNAHTAALCRAVRGLLEAFPDRKIIVLIEAEICKLGWRARPEDAVAWIEGVGVFVLEIKSHTIHSEAPPKERRQQSRSELHVACTRSSLRLELWGLRCSLMNEAENARDVLASSR